jgi:signal transduction histidine kinase
MNNLDIVGRESQRLANLINDVLDNARLESGRAHWHEDTVVLEELFRHTREAISGEMHENPSVKLAVSVQGNLPHITIDRDKLQQVLLNLLNNALKFTPQGVITLSSWVNDSTLCLQVHDTGIGISPDDLPFIFEKFQQARTVTLDEKPRGTGLGLAICKQIVEHYGGHFEVKSEVNKGSTFTIHFPLSRLKPVYEKVSL